jgi:hypothetical protein
MDHNTSVMTTIKKLAIFLGLEVLAFTGTGQRLFYCDSTVTVTQDKIITRSTCCYYPDLYDWYSNKPDSMIYDIETFKPDTYFIVYSEEKLTQLGLFQLFREREYFSEKTRQYEKITQLELECEFYKRMPWGRFIRYSFLRDNINGEKLRETYYCQGKKNGRESYYYSNDSVLDIAV